MGQKGTDPGSATLQISILYLMYHPPYQISAAAWAEFTQSEEGSKRPRFPAEVLGKGDSGGGRRSRFDKLTKD